VVKSYKREYTTQKTALCFKKGRGKDLDCHGQVAISANQNYLSLFRHRKGEKLGRRQTGGQEKKRIRSWEGNFGGRGWGGGGFSGRAPL